MNNNKHRGTRALLIILLLAANNALADWPVPDEFADKVDGLNDAQRAFVTSGDIIDFIPESQLRHELATREPDSLATLVNDLLAAAAEMGYSPARDMGAAPLNLTTDDFNGAVVTPAPLRKLQRDPGPFSVHRYLNPASGVPTFGGARVALWPEDLIAGGVDVAIIGVPSSAGSGVRDSRWAPDRMRAMNTIATTDLQSLLEPFEVLSVVDYGDFFVDMMSIELTVGHVTAMVAETAGTGVVPMLVGGDTSMVYPGVKGVAAHHGNGAFGLLHLSAHPDVERQDDHMLTDRQAIFRLLQEGVVSGEHTIQMGLRGVDVDAEALQWLREQGVQYHTMAEVRQEGFAAVFERVRREVDRGPEAFFVSIDISVVAPSDAIAAGRVEANGLAIEEVRAVIRQVCAAKNIVGFEITDVAPMMDLSRLSILHANAVLNACLGGMAVRAAGLEPDYVDPLALDHGQR